MARKIDETKPLFAIGTVADILNIKPRMLRHFEERGLLTPLRSDSNRRLYSLRDIDILSYIQYLISVKRVNIAGVLEIQRILKIMPIPEREKFMRDVEKEIESLPQQKKRIYLGEDEKLSEEMIEEIKE